MAFFFDKDFRHCYLIIQRPAFIFQYKSSLIKMSSSYDCVGGPEPENWMRVRSASYVHQF